MLKKSAKLAIRIITLPLAILFPNFVRRFLRLLSSYPRLYTSLARAMNITTHLNCVAPNGLLHSYKFEDLLIEEVEPILYNVMEPHCTMLLSKLDLTDGIVIDVGANYGYYSVLLSRYVNPGGIVYALEPDVRTLARLNHNLEINQCNNVFAVPYAISDTQKFQYIVLYEAEPWKNHLAQTYSLNEKQKVLPILTLSLDLFSLTIERKKIRLVKIDVEGAEVEALTGAMQLMKDVRPVFLIELHSKENTNTVSHLLAEAQYIWRTIEFISEERHHIFAFPDEKRVNYEELLNRIVKR
jgi:FkbM family methyltransferase